MATAICKTLLPRGEQGSLSKVVVFCDTSGCTSRGYICSEGNFSRFAREKRSPSTGLALLATQKGWFSVALLGAPLLIGYSERETSLALLGRERVALKGSLCSPLKSGGFLWHFWVHWLKVLKAW